VLHDYLVERAIRDTTQLHVVSPPAGADPGVSGGVGGVGYIVTIGIAVVSAPACLVAHFVVAIYYCFQQIRPGLPMGRSPAPDRA
jgi:hypothetical protein